MPFIQIIETHTSKFDELMALEAEWERATEGKRTLRRSIITRDRTDPDRYLVIAFFDSYESAMVNSNLPETAEFGEKQGALLDTPMAFTDLDVVDDRS
jgi:quinol monooxygenase YgiN